MKFKLTSNITNTEGAISELSKEQLVSLTNGITTSGNIVLNEDESLYISVEMYNRYNVDSIKYYYEGADYPTIYVSETDGLWYALTSVDISGGVQVNPDNYKPKNVKIVHSVSSNTDVYELEIYNNDSNVLFGLYGTEDSVGIDSSAVSVQNTKIYNSTPTNKDISVFIGDGSSLDEGLVSVGLTAAGPFYTQRQLGINLPGTFSRNPHFKSSPQASYFGKATLGIRVSAKELW